MKTPRFIMDDARSSSQSAFATPRFVQRSNDRAFPSEWQGDIFVWDIDKTYLDTRFSSLRGLLGIPFEFAVDKRAVPGTVPLLRALRHGPGEESALAPLYFVSGSPRELRRVVERKMTLDDVQFDGIAFKDQLALLRAGRPQSLLEQVGYKLQALLLYRRDHPRDARYVLFGDDVERDLEVFLLFGEICAGLRGAALRARLAAWGVHRADIEACSSLADALPAEPDPVRHIFIHQVRSAQKACADERVHTAPDFLTHAQTLAALGMIRSDHVAAVAEDTAVARGARTTRSR